MRKWIYTAAALAAAAGLGLLIWQLEPASWQRLDLDKIRSIPVSTMVYDAAGSALGPLFDNRERSFAALDEIPADVINAFIAAEDRRFYSHSGIDLRRIIGALWHDIKTRSLEQGASTITQQLVKLTHLSAEKTLARKAQEAVLALQLERKLEKDEILEAYLNTVYFGSGAYGIATAAQAYFGKDAGELSLAEGALLAGIIKSPAKYAPHTNPENALERRSLVLRAMEEAGFISRQQRDDAQAEALQLVPQAEPNKNYGWYMDLAAREAQEILDMDAAELRSAGLHIYTALQPHIQQEAEALFENGANFPDPAADGTPVQAALVAMDTADGAIAAVIGGRSYDVRMGLNRAADMQRQPGSAIKPVSTYAAAIDLKGFLPSSMVQDVQREFPGKYLPGNAGGSYYGTVTLREALSRSLNVATVDLADLIGMPAVRSTLEKFGIPPAPQDVNLALALGSMTYGVSPARLCAAYCTLANGGTAVEPHAVVRITDGRGRLVYAFEPPRRQVIKPQSAFLICDMLRTAAEEGSAKALASVGMPVMGKTGTVGEAGGGNRDIWTVAAVPELAAAVWMGFDQPGSGHALPDSAGGSSYPARLCAALFSGLSGSLSGGDFHVPDGLVSLPLDREALERYDEICLAAENTPPEAVLTEWFPEDKTPGKVSRLWDAPEAVNDLRIVSEPGSPAVLSFTARNGPADYLVLKKRDGNAEIAAVLPAEAGETVLWTDAQADPGAACTYSILPRNRLLYEYGVLLTGPESAAAGYAPGGFLNRLFGTG